MRHRAPASTSLGIAFAAWVFVCLPQKGAAQQAPAYQQRAQSEQRNGLRVFASALGAQESRETFGYPLARHDVQPLWLKIENDTDEQVTFVPVVTDPDYFSPLEVAYRFHKTFSADSNTAIDAVFLGREIQNEIPPRSTRTGFLYTNIDSGLKIANVMIASPTRVEKFSFVLTVPGPPFLGEMLRPEAVYPPDSVKHLDLDALRTALGSLPCCATDAKGTGKGDPLNLILIEGKSGLARPFIDRGWHVTDRLGARSAVEFAESFVFGTSYLSAPVSPLMLFGRAEDIAFQRARRNIDQRNHLRLWLAPMTFEGRRVWAGQISRDIGVHLTDKVWYLTTYKIGPDVDFDRDYLLQELSVAGFVARAGHVDGVGAAPMSAPRTNLTGDPYFTDGRRLVLFLSDDQTPFEKVERLEWCPPMAEKQ